jgi:hypothetical protein
VSLGVPGEGIKTGRVATKTEKSQGVSMTSLIELSTTLAMRTGVEIRHHHFPFILHSHAHAAVAA